MWYVTASVLWFQNQFIHIIKIEQNLGNLFKNPLKLTLVTQQDLLSSNFTVMARPGPSRVTRSPVFIRVESRRHI